MKKINYLIIHGLNGSPEGHWQDWLYKKLKSEGKDVYFPQFTNNSMPNLELWLEELGEVIDKLEGEVRVVAHSMGAILWLYYAEKQGRRVDKLLLAAPPSNAFLKHNNEGLDFADFPLNSRKLKGSSKEIILVASDNDKYCPEGAVELFGNSLQIDSKKLADEAGHINIESGYGTWSWAYDWISK